MTSRLSVILPPPPAAPIALPAIFTSEAVYRATTPMQTAPAADMGQLTVDLATCSTEALQAAFDRARCAVVDAVLTSEVVFRSVAGRGAQATAAPTQATAAPRGVYSPSVIQFRSLLSR